MSKRMSLLAQWLGDCDIAAFREHHLGQRPLAMPSLALDSIDRCRWHSLDRLLELDPAPDVLVVGRGYHLPLPSPRSLGDLRVLMCRGIGIALRQPHERCPDLAELCRALAEDIPGAQRVIVFATPAGVHGFSWHYDPEDVFILQTEGEKDYYFRANTVVGSPYEVNAMNFARLAEETSPLQHCRLSAGDWLYVPRGFWHVAYPQTDSLSVSIGIFPSPPVDALDVVQA